MIGVKTNWHNVGQEPSDYSQQKEKPQRFRESVIHLDKLFKNGNHSKLTRNFILRRQMALQQKLDIS